MITLQGCLLLEIECQAVSITLKGINICLHILMVPKYQENMQGAIFLQIWYTLQKKHVFCSLHITCRWVTIFPLFTSPPSLKWAPNYVIWWHRGPTIQSRHQMLCGRTSCYMWRPYIDQWLWFWKEKQLNSKLSFQTGFISNANNPRYCLQTHTFWCETPILRCQCSVMDIHL